MAHYLQSDLSNVDIAVVGGGMAGLMAAIEASKAGSRVMVLESKKEVGTPVQCGEAISDNTMKNIGLEPDGPWIAQPMEGYRIISPSGGTLFSKTKGFCIRRDLMERKLSEMAASEGAVVTCGNPVQGAERSDGGWAIRTLAGTVKADHVILACGANGHLARTFGFTERQECYRGLGIRLRREDRSKDLIFRVSHGLQGGYMWYFPRGDEVNAGVCARTDMVSWLTELRRVFDIKDSEVASYHGGSIPVSGLREQLVGSSCTAIGDAGGFSNPVTKGGIIGAVISGKEAGRAVAEHLSGDVGALRRWEGRMRSHVAFSTLNIKRAEFLASLDDSLLNEITGMVNGRNINSIPTTELMKMIVARPDLMRRLKKGVHLVRSGREWMKWSF